MAHSFKIVVFYLEGTSLVAQMVKHLPTTQETRFDPWVRKIPWRRKWQPTSVLFPGKYHRRRILVGYSPWGCKESDMTEWLHFLSLFSLGHTLPLPTNITKFFLNEIILSWVISHFAHSKIFPYRGTSLVVQWLRIHLSKQGTWVWSLVREVRSHRLQGN